MSPRPSRGPTVNGVRENLGALYPAVGQVEKDGHRLLVLSCPGMHKVNVSTPIGLPPPKRGRCKICRPPECGAISPAGIVCSLRPGHMKRSGEQLHERDGRRWAGDARVLKPA